MRHSAVLPQEEPVAVILQPPRAHGAVGLEVEPLPIDQAPARDHRAVLLGSEVEPRAVHLHPPGLHLTEAGVVNVVQEVPLPRGQQPPGLQPALQVGEVPRVLDLEPAGLPGAILVAVPPAGALLHPALTALATHVVVPVASPIHVRVPQGPIQLARASRSEEIVVGEHVHSIRGAPEPVVVAQRRRKAGAILHSLRRNSPPTVRATNVRVLDPDRRLIRGPMPSMVRRVPIVNVLGDIPNRIHVIVRGSPIRRERRIHRASAHVSASVMVKNDLVQGVAAPARRAVRMPHLGIRRKVNEVQCSLPIPKMKRRPKKQTTRTRGPPARTRYATHSTSCHNKGAIPGAHSATVVCSCKARHALPS